MIRELLARSPALGVPLGTLFLFMTVFVGAVVRAYGKGAKAALEAASRLPLEDEGSTRDEEGGSR